MIKVDPFFRDFFAEPAVLGTHSLRVIFDVVSSTYSDGYSTLSTHQIKITCKTVDVLAASAQQGSTITLRGKTYSVSDIFDDGTGITILTVME